uniref:Uncharacterized protein n=1 Tax=Anguilla anguilla TaxID=7936 RepID=A0A0E9X804_ANGAN
MVNAQHSTNNVLAASPTEFSCCHLPDKIVYQGVQLRLETVLDALLRLLVNFKLRQNCLFSFFLLQLMLIVQVLRNVHNALSKAASMTRVGTPRVDQHL